MQVGSCSFNLCNIVRLPLLEQPEERCDSSDIQNMGADSHDVVQDPGQLAKHHPEEGD